MHREDKHKIEVLLRAFKMNTVSFDYSVQFIEKAFSDSKSFNYHNFRNGFLVGISVAFIIKYFIKY